MKPTTALLFATVIAATSATAWAGSLGNGAAQRNAMYQHKQTAFEYCYGGNNHVEYFSGVFPLTPSGNGGGVKFGQYLTQSGYHNDGGQCRTAPTMAGAVAGKQESESIFQSAEYHHRPVVETEWAGAH
ncbi:MAG: hypothetical protein ACREPP_12435 [Rhodanobacteraceae bacterium]